LFQLFLWEEKKLEREAWEKDKEKATFNQEKLGQVQ